MNENESNKNLKSIGYKVKSAREEMGLTQEQFADKYGYARTTIAKLEAGIRDFKSTEIIALSEQLNVSTDYLLGKTNIKNPDMNIQAIGAYTGLSEKNIINLKNYNDRHKGKNEFIKNNIGIINQILSQPQFTIMLNNINIYLKSVGICEIMNRYEIEHEKYCKENGIEELTPEWSDIWLKNLPLKQIDIDIMREISEKQPLALYNANLAFTRMLDEIIKEETKIIQTNVMKGLNINWGEDIENANHN